MFGGKRHSGVIGGALLAACMAATGPAVAADLGGGCCADLEERIAELEATTARKGNRVVSLQLTGQVNQAILAWDDGVDSDTYVVQPTGSTLIDLKGEGRVTEKVKAGFFIEMAVYGEGQFLVDQSTDEALSPAFSDQLAMQHNALYIDHSELGRVWIGQTSGATDFITSINVAQSVGFRSAGAQLYNGSFVPRAAGTGAGRGYRLNDIYGNDGSQWVGEGHRYDLIKYESPSVAGFKFSAAWGEDDMWDVALRYAGLVGGRIKLAAGIGYGVFSESDSSTANGCTGNKDQADCNQLGMSFGAMDMGTGLFVHAAYGTRTDEFIEETPGLEGTTDSVYLQFGIEKNWFGVGATTLFGEYQVFDTGFNAGSLNAVGGAPEAFSGAEAEIWGFGVVQNFASASFDLFATFRNTSTESTDLQGVTSKNEDFQEVYAGGRIKF